MYEEKIMAKTYRVTRNEAFSFNGISRVFLKLDQLLIDGKPDLDKGIKSISEDQKSQLLSHGLIVELNSKEDKDSKKVEIEKSDSKTSWNGGK